MKLDQIVYAAIAVGLLIVGAAITYIVSYESRISKLETQLGFVLGAQSSLAAVGEEGEPDQVRAGAEPASPIADAIALQCAALTAQSSKILEGSVFGIGVGDKDRLAALSGLIDQLGCGTLAAQ